MTLEQAKYHLDKEYERAKQLEYVKNPLAYALHRVWKRADNKVYDKFVEKRILPVCVTRRIDCKSIVDESEKEYIKKKMIVDLAEYLMKNGFIRYTEETEGDIITILALLNIVG